jgi:hypothetical protein
MHECSENVEYLVFDRQRLPKTLSQAAAGGLDLVHGGGTAADRPALVLLVVPRGPAHDRLLHGLIFVGTYYTCNLSVTVCKLQIWKAPEYCTLLSSSDKRTVTCLCWFLSEFASLKVTEIQVRSTSCEYAWHASAC